MRSAASEPCCIFCIWEVSIACPSCFVSLEAAHCGRQLTHRNAQVLPASCYRLQQTVARWPQAHTAGTSCSCASGCIHESCLCLTKPDMTFLPCSAPCCAEWHSDICQVSSMPAVNQDLVIHFDSALMLQRLLLSRKSHDVTTLQCSQAHEFLLLSS